MRKLLICLLVFVGMASGTALADILIIVNKDVPETSLSRSEIQKIFLGKQIKWKDGTVIHPVILNDKEIHGAFLKGFIKRSIGKWNAYWKMIIFSGQGSPPKSINTEAELISHVKDTKGAIGYVSSDNVPQTENTTIKIITVK